MNIPVAQDSMKQQPFLGLPQGTLGETPAISSLDLQDMSLPTAFGNMSIDDIEISQS